MTLAELRRVRLSLGLSQEVLARELHVHRLSVIRWEGGSGKIPFLLEFGSSHACTEIGRTREETKSTRYYTKIKGQRDDSNKSKNSKNSKSDDSAVLQIQSQCPFPEALAKSR